MADTRNNGGPAFPRHQFTPLGQGQGQWSVEGGMTLRDWFAGDALAATDMREETEMEHMARDMREGRFPAQSAIQMVPVEENTGDMLARIGMDARLWAEEFHKTAQRLGYQPMDEGWLIGWFANAIMQGYDRAARPVAEVQAEAVAGAYLAAGKAALPPGDGWRGALCEAAVIAAQQRVLAATPADAAAALDRRDADVRNQALREAAEALKSMTLDDIGKLADDPLGVWVQTIRAGEKMILALIKEPAHD